MTLFGYERGRMRAVFVTLTLLMIAGSAAAQLRRIEPTYGEPVNTTFPNWQERAVHELVNRARVQPSTEIAGCGGNCQEPAGCYVANVPVYWTYDLNQSARFESASMARFPFFAHDTPCALFSDIDSRYPGTSDGSFSTSCSGSGTTDPGTRISLFGSAWSAENIAAGTAFPGPFDVFYTGWLYEFSSNTACTSQAISGTDQNGHRYNIFKSAGPALGVGYDTLVGSPWGIYWTQDFGGPSVTIPRIPSGSHWTSVNHDRDPSAGDQTVEFWANWYDTAGGPLIATVVLDGTPIAMTHPANRGTLTNGAWTTSVASLSAACHTYYYAFTSSTSVAVRYPDTGTLGFGTPACPDWQNPPVCVAPVVVGQPASTTIAQGNSTTLSVSATGTTLSYQWYVGTSGTTTNPVPGATSSSLTVGPGSTTSYWVQVSNTCGTANSNTATVTVTPVATSAKFFVLSPCRILDTRGANGPSGGPAIPANGIRNIVVVGTCGLPSGITALAANAVAVSPPTQGYVTVYPGPSGSAQPFASTLFYTAGRTLANNATVSVGADGSINIFNSGNTPLNLVIDINGYFK